MAGLLDGYRPFNPGEFIINPDGTQSTERTVTLQTDDGWLVAPSLWETPMGAVDLYDKPDLHRAIQGYEKLSKKMFPRFKTLEEANKFTSARTSGGGVFQGLLADQ